MSVTNWTVHESQCSLTAINETLYFRPNFFYCNNTRSGSKSLQLLKFMASFTNSEQTGKGTKTRETDKQHRVKRS